VSATTEADATAEAADPIEADVDAPLSPSPEAEEAARLEAVSVELAAPAPEPALSGPEREVADFCSAVFHPGALSFESSRVFDERFAGRQVTWSGTLKAVEPYRFDFVFGQDPGTKATFVIHAAEGATFGGGEISAVIQLPAGSDGLDSRIGEDLQFSGTLEKVDGFVRNVFLTNANIQ
jgi:hypothetical protein